MEQIESTVETRLSDVLVDVSVVILEVLTMCLRKGRLVQTVLLDGPVQTKLPNTAQARESGDSVVPMRCVVGFSQSVNGITGRHLFRACQNAIMAIQFL